MTWTWISTSKNLMISTKSQLSHLMAWKKMKFVSQRSQMNCYWAKFKDFLNSKELNTIESMPYTMLSQSVSSIILFIIKKWCKTFYACFMDVQCTCIWEAINWYVTSVPWNRQINPKTDQEFKPANTVIWWQRRNRKFSKKFLSVILPGKS